MNCVPLLTALCLSSVGIDAPPAPANTVLAWTMLEEGAASASADTRARAVESLGLLVKNDRARKLAESKLRDQDR